ncbi:MAG: hypothetical protein KFH87_09995, partial [Bacteroidetes bacterium]|nr:hypothetical protein [Bacteroidota bacterium]
PGEVRHRLLVLPLYRNGVGEEPMLVALPSGSGIMKCVFTIRTSSGDESTCIAECNLNVTGIEYSPLWGPEKTHWWENFAKGHPGTWRVELEELMSKHADAPYKNTIIRSFSTFLLKHKSTREPFLGMEGDKSIVAARHYLMQWIFKRPNEFSAIIFMEAIRRYQETRLMVCRELMNDSAVTNPIVADYLLNSFCKRPH